MPAALITGGGRRLGKAIALHLAENGYDIALHYNRSEAEAEATAAAIRAHGVGCEIFSADLGDTHSYESLIDKAYKAFPALEVLVNNASVFERGDFLESDIALSQHQFRINYEAPVFLTHAFAGTVKNGSVINMLDAKMVDHKHSYFHYLLSKKALAAFTKMAAVELGPNIRVNGVAPGYILPSEGWGEEYRQKLEARLPLGKVATPQDIAQAVYLLISTVSLTGQIMFVDGGESLL